MKIETKFSCGDKVWCVGPKLRQLTVGQVRVEYTDSTGINNGAIMEDEPDIRFDNYKPQKNYVETYMMVETGVGSGSVYTLGIHCFQTKEEAEVYQKKLKEEYNMLDDTQEYYN